MNQSINREVQLIRSTSVRCVACTTDGDSTNYTGTYQKNKSTSKLGFKCL